MAMVPVVGLEIAREATPKMGCRVLAVRKDSPAERAGITPAHWIKRVGAVFVASHVEFERGVQGKLPGDVIKFTICTEWSETTVELELGARGVGIERVRELRKEFDIVVVKSRQRGGRAADPVGWTSDAPDAIGSVIDALSDKFKQTLHREALDPVSREPMVEFERRHLPSRHHGTHAKHACAHTHALAGISSRICV